MATFTWPAIRPYAQSVSLSAVGSTITIPRYGSVDVYSYSGTTLTNLNLTVPGVTGWIASAVDRSNNTWLLARNGSYAISFPDTLPLTTTSYTTTVKTAWAGVTTVGSVPYFLSTDGTLFTTSGSTVAQLTGGTFSQEAIQLATDGTKLYTLLPGVSELGVFTLSNSTSGTASTVSTPMTTPSCLAASTSGVAVGGWSAASIAQASTSLAASPVAPTTTSVSINVATNAVVMVSGNDPVWTVTQTVTGTGAPSSLCWTPAGTQVLVGDTTNGKLQVYNLTGSTLSAGSLLSVAGITSVAVTPDGTQAVATQPGGNALQVLTDTLGTWSLGASVTDTNTPQTILALSNAEMVYGVTGGISFLDYATAAWSTTVHISGFGFTPTYLATDGLGNIFAVGTSGGNGYLAVASKISGLVTSTSWTGSADAILWNQGQIFVVDSTSSLVRSFSYTSNTLTAQHTAATPAGCKGIAVAGESVWLSGSSQLSQFLFTAPFEITAQTYGSVSAYVSGAWHTATLPVAKKPSAVTWDGSGNIWAVTETNDLYEITASGSITSTATVPVPTGQVAGTPLGLSSLLWNGGHLYASTSLLGALVEIS